MPVRAAYPSHKFWLAIRQSSRLHGVKPFGLSLVGDSTLVAVVIESRTPTFLPQFVELRSARLVILTKSIDALGPAGRLLVGHIQCLCVATDSCAPSNNYRDGPFGHADVCPIGFH